VLVATLGWLAVLGFVLWWWVLRPRSAADVAVPLALKLAGRSTVPEPWSAR
jgi:hypothetical protein